MIKTKRAYEEASPTDGLRVLVDRLWPRGITKQRARIDLWLKDVAPSNGLRRRFGHDPEKWESFQEQYGRELDGKQELLAELKRLERENKIVTLVFGAKDERRNNAEALRARLVRRRDGRG